MYLLQTVQSSWRPQLPLPKEIQFSNDKINQQPHLFPRNRQERQDDDIDKIHQIIENDMERFHMSKKNPSSNTSQISNASHNNSSSKKWSFGRLFRRGKKEIESESSSEEDRKAGFSPSEKYSSNCATASTPSSKKSKSKSSSSQRTGKLVSAAIDPNVITQLSGNSSSTVTSPLDHQHVDTEFFLPVETVSSVGSQEPFYQNHYNPSQQSAQPQRLHHSQQYLPHIPQAQQQLKSRSAYSLDRSASKLKQRNQLKSANCTHDVIMRSSSEEDLISLNSSTFSKYRSDESIHSGGQGQNNGQSRRSRAARNERYYKRLSRDGEVSHGQVPVLIAQPITQKWKTQPVSLSIYQAPVQRLRQQQAHPQIRSSTDNVQHPKLRNTSSLQHMTPYVQWGHQRQQQTKNLQNSVNDAKRSISYDSQIHLQNVNGKLQSKPMPPPPPPRDPLRKVNVSGHIHEGSASDLRPVSYAFDQTGLPVLPASSGLIARCVSDDKIWALQQPQYHSIRSLNIAPSQGSTQIQQNNRRFITRAERDAQPGKKSLPNGLDFHYIADATPRSRKPIHMLDQMPSFADDVEEPQLSGVLRTTKSGLPSSPTKINATEFWKRMEDSTNKKVTPTPAPRGRDLQRPVGETGFKPRSISSSHVEKLRAYPMPLYSEVYKPNKSKASAHARSGSPHHEEERDEVDSSVVCGSLRIKPAKDSSTNIVEIRNKDVNKSHSMPDHYQRCSGEITTIPNKYEEYVNERKEQHCNAPQPPMRKLSGTPNIPHFYFPRKKPANLEEAINELEAIYRSLGLTEPEPEPEVPKKERAATPNDFDKFALAHADEYDDDDSNDGEPDPITDDVAYRNIKLANLQHKTTDKQPPFGIPVGPIVPASQSDYLHVIPKPGSEHSNKNLKSPDVVKDDLAVRALRKDPILPKSERYHQYPTGSMLKKNRATRTQSANIYALIQRDAAKPSGGDLISYLELTKSIDRSGSLSDIHRSDSTNDVPSTLKLLQSLKEQEKEHQTHCQNARKSHIPFRHPSQGGAIYQLPEKLVNCEGNVQKRPKPMPRKSLTPEPKHCDTHKMEDALNKIAQDAQESSIKLTQELNELRKEALITHSRPKCLNSQEEKIELELQEIEKVSQAAKQCGKMLLDNLPDCMEPVEETAKMSRKLHKEDKLIKAIDQVSVAANKVCEKILKDIVTTEPPVLVQEAVRVQQHVPHDEEIKTDSISSLVTPSLIKKLDPIQSDNIEAIARRCMLQLSDLAENHDYDNLNQPEITVASTCNLEDKTKHVTPNDLSTSNLTESHKLCVTTKANQVIDEIDQIMKECEDQARSQEMVLSDKTTQPKKTSASSATASSFSSSSDCLAKSSSPSASRRFSSSITSFNPYSSSDYIKSPSSDYHAPSTDRLKSCSTTSYDVQSTTSATPNITTTTNSNFSGSPSPPPPLNLTPVSNFSAALTHTSQTIHSSSPSQYNSSEELAMIFGIDERAKALRNRKLQKNSGNMETPLTTCDPRSPEQQLPLTAASPPFLYTAIDCCSEINPSECCLLNLSSFVMSSSITNNNASSPQHFTSSSSPSFSSRLQTIPEKDGPVNIESFSPNFNRNCASKVFIDQSGGEQPQYRPHITHFDSISCLEEENSSNPDSGNVSLADFPLGSHGYIGSLHQPSYVSRIEVRNSFITEVAIKTEELERNCIATISCEKEDFPPLPTEDELMESLKECLAEPDCMCGGQKELNNECFDRRGQNFLGDHILMAREEIMAQVKAVQASVFTREEMTNAFESGNSIKDLKDDREKSLREFQDEIIDSFEGELVNLFDEINMIKEKVILKVEDHDIEDCSQSENFTSLEANSNDGIDFPSSWTPERKRSFVFETPCLKMNILEEKYNYEFNMDKKQDSVLNVQDAGVRPKKAFGDHTLKQEHKLTVLSLQELSLNCYLNAYPEMQNKTNSDIDLEENFEQSIFKSTDVQQSPLLMENEIPSSGNQIESKQRLVPWQPLPHMKNGAQENPSGSAKAYKVVNVFGQCRPQPVSGLTLLEHLVVVCALGLINTDDLFTLGLIIIAIVIIIAIALF